ncbi:Bug family tripartite tricarboxylate transporter substrate binding protein [Marinobacter sp. BSs20148]|jgi:tripartite-type tricarboxylate transporter receptor subunit TctC|uniref:Bug family tripartite tricarboxylate transporter substrate binding protein n=1 Tax=Marinobacter sp. BSs20148 TaxID=490759 RepID=UPI00059FB166|nr:tripartite tricarboxylate transporter substrate-binding protein [Marinobacter sp. BSs20148]
MLATKLITLAAWITLGAMPLAHAEDNFYEGKTVQLLIGYSAGGGYDSYARTLARHVGKHIPGNPDVITKNVPGAGSLVLMNQLANTLPKDGTVFGTVSRGLAFEPLFGNDKARFDPTKTSWLGSLNNETSLCVASTNAKVQKWQDLRDTKLVVGATGSGGDSNVFPRVLNEVLGFQFEVIAGYPGSNDIQLALERDEVQGICSWSYSSSKEQRQTAIEQGTLRNLFQMSLRKHPDLPNLPLVTDFAETQKEREVLRLMFARQAMGRPFVAPAGVPNERVAILRKAILDTTKDSDFLADAQKQGLDIDFVSGEEIQEIVTEAYNYPEDVIDIIKKAISN